MKYAAKFTALIFFLFPLLLQIKVLIDICNSTRGVCIAGMFYSYESCDHVQNITLKKFPNISKLSFTGPPGPPGKSTHNS